MATPRKRPGEHVVISLRSSVRARINQELMGRLMICANHGGVDVAEYIVHVLEHHSKARLRELRQARPELG